MCSFPAIPVKDAEENENVAIIVTSRGGHIGFMEGIFPRHKNYMYRLFRQYMDAIFKHGKAEGITDNVTGEDQNCQEEEEEDSSSTM